MTALPQEDLELGMTAVDGRYSLPPLPGASFRLIWNESGKTSAAEALAQLLAEMAEATLE